MRAAAVEASCSGGDRHFAVRSFSFWRVRSSSERGCVQKRVEKKREWALRRDGRGVDRRHDQDEEEEENKSENQRTSRLVVHFPSRPLVGAPHDDRQPFAKIPRHTIIGQ